MQSALRGRSARRQTCTSAVVVISQSAWQVISAAAEVSVLDVVLGLLENSVPDVQSAVDCDWETANEAAHKLTLIQLINHSMPCFTSHGMPQLVMQAMVWIVTAGMVSAKSPACGGADNVCSYLQGWFNSTLRGYACQHTSRRWQPEHLSVDVHQLCPEQ